MFLHGWARASLSASETNPLFHCGGFMYLSFADFVYFLSSGAECFKCEKYVVFITLHDESQRTVTPPSPATLNLYPDPKMMALFVTLLLEGAPLFYEVLSGYHLVRFAIAALLFTLAQGLVLTAFCVGASPVEVVTFGYIHMPVSAVLSYFAFSRRYGRLEWLSVGMLTLGVLAFVLLREESAEGETLQLELHGFLLVMGSVFASVLGSIIAERIFKDRSGREGKQDRFYAIKLHLDLSALIIAAKRLVALVARVF
ncbi:unnamed protein product [Symbiodinium sp. CCMP2592]|nr:unnamed protein product [Symbiodinium sp. CCMP2592]